ncbi:hypothetical protein ACFSM5_04075 [Lacibacterium aquatile]|uniref:Uncharacterized protein n=1 Tax=Lacibacterium aquatile TaxID=1168082 RepID=A0ABW5DNF3_9PROT
MVEIAPFVTPGRKAEITPGSVIQLAQFDMMTISLLAVDQPEDERHKKLLQPFGVGCPNG